MPANARFFDGLPMPLACFRGTDGAAGRLCNGLRSGLPPSADGRLVGMDMRYRVMRIWPSPYRCPRRARGRPEEREIRLPGGSTAPSGSRGPPGCASEWRPSTMRRAPDTTMAPAGYRRRPAKKKQAFAPAFIIIISTVAGWFLFGPPWQDHYLNALGGLAWPSTWRRRKWGDTRQSPRRGCAQTRRHRGADGEAVRKASNSPQDRKAIRSGADTASRRFGPGPPLPTRSRFARGLPPWPIRVRIIGRLTRLVKNAPIA